MIAKANDGDTMYLWRQVEKSDTEFTKDVSLGKRRLTAICAQYQAKRATQLWGPYGHRWGLRNLRYSTIEADGTVTMALDAEFFYPGPEGQEVSFEIGHDMPFRPNNETRKKLRTSCQSKALSLLGFNADIHMGKFEDNEYVNALRGAASGQKDLYSKVAAGFEGKLSLSQIETRWARVEEMHSDDLLTDAEVGDLRALAAEARKRAFYSEKRMLTAMLRDKCGCVEAEDFAAAVQYLTGDDDVHTPEQIATALAKLREYEAGGGDCSQILALAKGVDA